MRSRLAIEARGVHENVFKDGGQLVIVHTCGTMAQGQAVDKVLRGPLVTYVTGGWV